MIEWLYGLQHFGIKLGLDNMRALLGVLDHPERAQPAIVIAGTNGKGSVAAMLHAMLGASGLRSGLFTSPHLVRPTERIRIGDDDVSPATLDRALARVRGKIEQGLARGELDNHPSFFEVITASALDVFRDETLDVAVLEVGLGGALDATNAVDGAVAAIVSIDLDHMKTLGETIEAIAAEKAGIVRPGRPVVSGVARQRARSVIERVCRERGASLIDARVAVAFDAEHDGLLDFASAERPYSGLSLALAGRHQIDNARVALATLESFLSSTDRVPDPDAVRRGLATVRWPGRLQWVRSTADHPDLLFDGAHNPAATRTLASYLDSLRKPAPVAVFAAMRGKLLGPMLDDLAPRLHAIVLTRPGVDRACEPEELEVEARRRFAHVEVVREPRAALARAIEIAQAERFVLITGSLYLVGTVLADFEQEPSPGPVAM